MSVEMQEFVDLFIIVLLYAHSVKAPSQYLRLVHDDVSDVGHGRLEIFYNGVWGTICRNGFSDTEAVVACRTIGYSVRQNRLCPVSFHMVYTENQESSKVWLYHVQCTGDETNFFNCPHSPWGSNACKGGDKVGINCTVDNKNHECCNEFGIANGNVTFTNKQFTGSVGTVHCNKGYLTSVNNTVTCLIGGIWNRNIPECKQIAAVPMEIKTCKENKDSRNTLWNETDAGQMAWIPCEEGFTGGIIRTCTNAGHWLLPKYNCVKREIGELDQMSTLIPEHPSTDKVDVVLGTLQKLTILAQSNLNSGHMMRGNITTGISILMRIANNSENVLEPERLYQVFMNAASSLLDMSNVESRKSMLHNIVGNEASNEAIQILDAIEVYTEAIVKSFANETAPLRTVTNNFVLQVGTISGNGDFRFPDSTNLGNIKCSFYIPSFSLNASYRYSVVVYKNISAIFPSTSSFGSENEVYEINSAILSVKIDGWKANANFRIQIVMEHLQKQYRNAVCSFWDTTRRMWHSIGCSLVNSTESMSVCECNHLTNFALLMSPWTQVNVISKAMDIITMTGCIISILCLVITFAVYTYLWRFLKTSKNSQRRFTIIINLSISLILAYSLFLGGVDKVENKAACTTVAVLLHYIYLVVFFIMLAWGIDITRILFSVVPTYLPTRLVLIAAWCIPLLIVAVSMGVTKLNGYGNSNFCWVSIDGGLIWAFVGPALVIIVINTALLVIVIKKIFAASLTVRKDKLEKIKLGIKGLLTLLPLMGITWGIGIFYVNTDAVWVQYVFAVCNGLQGFVLFLFNCVFDKKIRLAITRKSKRYPTTSSKTDNTKVSKQKLSSALTLRERM